jgi:hypothetical protein
MRNPELSPKIDTEIIQDVSSRYAPNNASQIVELFVTTAPIRCQSNLSDEFDWINNRNAFQRLTNLADLPDRWDGYDAPKFARSQINRALELFSSIQAYAKKNNSNWELIEPFISPASDGTILFEWAGQRFPDHQLEVYIPRESTDPLEYLQSDLILENDTEGECQAKEISNLLDWLFNSTI